MQKIILGRLGTAFGIKGWSKVYSYTEPPENILQFDEWLILHKKEWLTATVLEKKVMDRQIIVKLSLCRDREHAKTFANDSIAVYKEHLPQLKQEEYYWDDLIGLTVVNQQNEILGKVIQIMATGSNDVLVVKNSRKHFIPYISTVVLKIDLANKTILVDWESNAI